MCEKIDINGILIFIIRKIDLTQSINAPGPCLSTRLTLLSTAADIADIADRKGTARRMNRIVCG